MQKYVCDLCGYVYDPLKIFPTIGFVRFAVRLRVCFPHSK